MSRLETDRPTPPVGAVAVPVATPVLYAPSEVVNSVLFLVAGLAFAVGFNWLVAVATDRLRGPGTDPGGVGDADADDGVADDEQVELDEIDEL